MNLATYPSRHSPTDSAEEAEIILVGQGQTDASKIAQEHDPRVLDVLKFELESRIAVLSLTNLEKIEVAILPAHRDLKDLMKLHEG
jgi:hypothetical protein